MNRSESTKSLFAALAKAQGQIRNAAKDSVNPHFKSNYADLASVWEACRAPLSSNGLSVVQLASAAPGPKEIPVVVVESILCHESGEWVSGELAVVPGQAGVQAVGAAITYLRRFALSALVGIAPDDDDGESDRAARPSPSKPAPRRADPIAPPRAAPSSAPSMDVKGTTVAIPLDDMPAAEVPMVLVDTLAKRIREAVNVRPQLLDLGAEVKLAAESGAITPEERTFLGECLKARKLQLTPAAATEQAA